MPGLQNVKPFPPPTKLLERNVKMISAIEACAESHMRYNTYCRILYCSPYRVIEMASNRFMRRFELA